MPTKCPIKRKEIVKKYVSKNLSKIRERKRLWRKNNPIKMKASKTNARAKRRGAMDKIDVSILEKMLISANGICTYCGIKKENIGFDHIVPLSLGGKHVVENIAVCCLKCNQIKYNKNISDFKKYCKDNGIKLNPRPHL